MGVTARENAILDLHEAGFRPGQIALQLDLKLPVVNDVIGRLAMEVVNVQGAQMDRRIRSGSAALAAAVNAARSSCERRA